MKGYMKGIGFYVLLFFLIIFIFTMTSMPGRESKLIYSDLVLKIQQGEVSELAVADNIATAKLTDGSVIEVEIPGGYIVLKSDVGDTIQQQIEEGKLKVDTPLPYSPPWWLSLLPSLGLLIIFVVFWFMMMQQSGGGGGRGVMNFGKSKARVTTDGKTQKTFDAALKLENGRAVFDFEKRAPVAHGPRQDLPIWDGEGAPLPEPPPIE